MMIKHIKGYYRIWRPEHPDLGFTDATFVMGKGMSKTVFYVHRKILLSCGSRKFEQMFSGAPDDINCIRKTNDDPEVFELLMNFLYTEYDKFTSWIHICKLCIIGEKYQVPDIGNIAEEYMVNITEECRIPVKITERNIWEAIENNVFSCSLLHKMHDYFKENAKKLICSENIFNAPEKFVLEVLQMDALNIDECDLLAAVTEWGYRNMEQANFENLKKLYKHIRFGALKFHDFLQFKACYPAAIDDKNTRDIVEYLYSTTVRNLPEWCSSNHVWRKNEFMLQKRLKMEDEQNDDNINEEREQNNNVSEEREQNYDDVFEEREQKDDQKGEPEKE